MPELPEVEIVKQYLNKSLLMDHLPIVVFRHRNLNVTN